MVAGSLKDKIPTEKVQEVIGPPLGDAKQLVSCRESAGIDGAFGS
jgi:hypothetical protein